MGWFLVWVGCAAVTAFYKIIKGTVNQYMGRKGNIYIYYWYNANLI